MYEGKGRRGKVTIKRKKHEVTRRHRAPVPRGAAPGLASRGQHSPHHRRPAAPGPASHACAVIRVCSHAHTHRLVLIQLVQSATPEKSNSISALCSSTIPPSRCSQSLGAGARFKNTCMPSTRCCICCLSKQLSAPCFQRGRG